MVVTFKCHYPVNKPPHLFCPMLACTRGGGIIVGLYGKYFTNSTSMHIICKECAYTVSGACTCTTHGINTPLPCMEHACSTHGIHQYYTWNMPVPCMEYASKYMEHMCIDIMNISCMKCATIPCMKYMDSIWNCAPYA